MPQKPSINRSVHVYVQDDRSDVWAGPFAAVIVDVHLTARFTTHDDGIRCTCVWWDRTGNQYVARYAAFGDPATVAPPSLCPWFAFWAWAPRVP